MHAHHLCGRSNILLILNHERKKSLKQVHHIKKNLQIKCIDPEHTQLWYEVVLQLSTNFWYGVRWVYLLKKNLQIKYIDPTQEENWFFISSAHS